VSEAGRPAEFQDARVAALVAFCRACGFDVVCGSVPDDAFLPGIAVASGALTVDESKLKYPGDLLHEAGHLAVMDATERANAGEDAGSDGGAEMAAIAWSYAAALAIGIDPAVVFHADGYKGGAAAILTNFQAGRYIGVPLLEWFGMTGGDCKYPAMRRWLR
jgi:hypothetical protein